MTQAPGPAAIMDIHDAYEAQKDHMSMIACSLGACPECWGHDPDCTECVGEGRPGAFLPDELMTTMTLRALKLMIPNVAVAVAARHSGNLAVQLSFARFEAERQQCFAVQMARRCACNLVAKDL